MVLLPRPVSGSPPWTSSKTSTNWPSARCAPFSATCAPTLITNRSPRLTRCACAIRAPLQGVDVAASSFPTQGTAGARCGPASPTPPAPGARVSKQPVAPHASPQGAARSRQTPGPSGTKAPAPQAAGRGSPWEAEEAAREGTRACSCRAMREAEVPTRGRTSTPSGTTRCGGRCSGGCRRSLRPRCPSPPGESSFQAPGDRWLLYLSLEHLGHVLPCVGNCAVAAGTRVGRRRAGSARPGACAAACSPRTMRWRCSPRRSWC